MDIYIGFDPGGNDNFGWAVCLSEGKLLRVIDAGLAGQAKAAVNQAISAFPKYGNLVGAGIDAPLFWTEDGCRHVDELVRHAIQMLGARFSGGTVQHVNSLRGACLVQGILTAKLLHDHLPHIVLTEAHPKALLYLLGIAGVERNPASITFAHLSEFVACDANIGEHERDSVLAAITASAQKMGRQGWINLFEKEPAPIVPFGYPVSYWMPWDRVH
jgi:hypothetical protein